MRAPERLSDTLATQLQQAPFSYPEVGATGTQPLPGGYRHLHKEITIADDDGGSFERLVDGLFGWRIHLGAGLLMRVSAPRVAPGVVLMATLPLGPVRVHTRCRVVEVIVNDSVAGFSYGTLPGHPERGEERFLMRRVDNEHVRFSLTAFSRMASPLARFGGPISRSVQDWVNGRYLRAAASL